ncbi:FG-GAP-like repeat-containing protein [Pseudobacteriovorax antillogorgiicola]|uniref:Uncharacterized membrane protein YraQ, UPF0718 family n=1 Tax=Pseudobacteriovorax antillogorgiicola TaxID=1513793 RepID=A0A1Y6C5I5_9BACT|nr:FG-GAP-like repeat-containing protein [Pseudobacteriovorax antillogorgiicola]TCS51141.1 uncharacterized membrane protein YraQ (UPF0718 family) [Pseudobacteriovorax antillogorgiicola]SMF38361.1 Uncharacterized membrane protein YraQ, UPF0718 family [Pseudobacteriovorax antillogorgiicola]
MILYPKRFAFVALLISFITISFWTGSRYPALNQKAMMAESASVADTIAAFPILEVKDEFPMWKKIAYTTVNWANDNKKGMTFGVIIGGLFLTLFNYLQFRQKGNKMLKTFYGFLLGSPLGVCVNCAAPVFKGVLQSKQAELAFAMMISSPTMNMVVLTMLFSLFPFYMAVTKTLFVLIVIFAGVPLISTLLGADHQLKDWLKLEKEDVNLGQNCDVKHREPYGEAIFGFLKDIFRNIKFIIVRTVPLMLVAGFLGSVVSHLVSLDTIMAGGGIGVVLLVAAVGLFLPVPVAFDIILVNALFTAGMAPNLTLILLCTLGIYSSYSFMITWQSASKQWATGLSAVIFLMAVALGLTGDQLHRVFYLEPNIEAYKTMRGAPEAVVMEEDEILVEEQEPAKPLIFQSVWQKGNVIVEGAPFQVKTNQEGRFARSEGQFFGLREGFAYGIRDYPDPFWIGRGTGSGDFNGDGWQDVAFGSDTGIKLYRNVGGLFEKVLLTVKTSRYRVYSVAFIDWNNDGWLDLFFTTYLKGNFVIYNKNGVFSSELEPVPNNKGILTVSPSFGDFDRNGFPDIYNANMALGIVTGFHHYGPGRQNSITFNHGDRYQEAPLDQVDGESMASLVSDFNQDGWLDIYVNNDFTVPDYLYFGKSGGLALASRDAMAKMKSPFFSMSIDSGDLNNDGTMDYVSSGTIETAKFLADQREIDGVPYKDYSIFKNDESWCESIQEAGFRQRCLADRKLNKRINLKQKPKLDVAECSKIKESADREDCLLAVMWMIVTSNQPVDNCQEKFGFDQTIREVCDLHKARKAPLARDLFQQYMAQEDKAHIYLGDGHGSFRAMPVAHPGGWTWSMKIADLDNDGWLDIFNAEGAVREGQFGFNVLLHNQEGKGFEQRQFSWGMVDDFGMFSFSYIDFDHDGDLDIIANSAVGPVRLYENRLNNNNRLAVMVNQKTGNYYGLHSKIQITTGSGRTYLREIKAGGGYQSFDAPIAYFGLGEDEQIQKIVLSIPGREAIEINEKLPANQLYRISIQ